MDKSIRLASGLDIPFNITTQKVAIMGGNGSGKTYTATKIEEEILSENGWIVIFDPVGIHYGLRLDKTGKKPSGLDIPVFGGLHGDVILTPESGALIADLICDRRLSAVLDVSQFESDAELNRFATDFGNRFWNRMKSQRRAVMLVLEECQEFVPQNPMKGEEKKLHIYTRIAKLGRNYGIGVTLISQRPQEVNKKVLNLTQLMFAFQMTGIHERKTMEEWFTYVGYESKLGNILPTLEVGEPYVMSPRWLKINKKVKILPKRTFDASATPDFDEDNSETVHLKPIDISMLEEAMSKQIQQAKENDPAELKKEIARLRRELEKKPISVPSVETKIDRVEVPVFTNENIHDISTVILALNEIGGHFKDQVNRIVGSVEMLKNSVEDAKRLGRQAHAVSQAVKLKFDFQKTEKTAPQEGVTTPQQRILNSIAWLESVHLFRPQRNVVAFLSEQSPKSSGFSNNLGALRSQGLINYPESKTIELTDAGRELAQKQDEPISANEVQDAIVRRLPRPQARILELLIAAYPDPLDRDLLAERVGQSPLSSGYKNNLGALRSLGVIDYAGSQAVKALPVLFLE